VLSEAEFAFESNRSPEKASLRVANNTTSGFANVQLHHPYLVPLTPVGGYQIPFMSHDAIVTPLARQPSDPTQMAAFNKLKNPIQIDQRDMNLQPLLTPNHKAEPPRSPPPNDFCAKEQKLQKGLIPNYITQVPLDQLINNTLTGFLI